MAVSVFIARRIDAGLFAQVHQDVFDAAVDAHLLERFLAADHLHIAVAVDRDLMIGVCSGVIHHRPDRPDSFWITRLAVAPPWRRLGIGTRLVMTASDHARRLGCHEIAAMALPGDAGVPAFWDRLRWTRTGTGAGLVSCPL